MSADVQIRGADGAAPQSYTVPNATEIIPKAVTALFNGAAASGAFVPTIEIVSDGGVVVARVPTSTTVVAGGSAEVTFAPFLKGQAQGVVAGFLTTLIETNPDAIWTLDETSGTVAHDILSGHHDAGTLGSTPTWAAIPAPTTTVQPLFGNNQGFATGSSAYLPVLSGDFSMAGFFRYEVRELSSVMGNQVHGGPSNGFGVIVNGPADLNPNHLNLAIATGIGEASVVSDLPIALSTEYWVAITRIAGLWTLYVNGSPQVASYSGAYSGLTGAQIWLGYDGSGFPGTATKYQSMMSLWATRGLSPAEIAGIWDAV